MLNSWALPLKIGKFGILQGLEAFRSHSRGTCMTELRAEFEKMRKANKISYTKKIT